MDAVGFRDITATAPQSNRGDGSTGVAPQSNRGDGSTGVAPHRAAPHAPPPVPNKPTTAHRSPALPGLPSYEEACGIPSVPMMPNMSSHSQTSHRPTVLPKPAPKPLVKPHPKPEASRITRDNLPSRQATNSTVNGTSTANSYNAEMSQPQATNKKPTMIRPKKSVSMQNIGGGNADTAVNSNLPSSSSMHAMSSAPTPAVKPKIQPGLLPKPMIAQKTRLSPSNQRETSTSKPMPVKVLPTPSINGTDGQDAPSNRPTIIRPVRTISVPDESRDNTYNENKENSDMMKHNDDTITAGSNGVVQMRHSQSMFNVSNVQRGGSVEGKPKPGPPPPLPSSNPVPRSHIMSRSMMDISKAGLSVSSTNPNNATRTSHEDPGPTGTSKATPKPVPRARPQSMYGSTQALVTASKQDNAAGGAAVMNKKVPPKRPPPPSRPPLPSADKLRRPASMMNLSTDFSIFDKVVDIDNHVDPANDEKSQVSQAPAARPRPASRVQPHAVKVLPSTQEHLNTSTASCTRETHPAKSPVVKQPTTPPSRPSAGPPKSSGLPPSRPSGGPPSKPPSSGPTSTGPPKRPTAGLPTTKPGVMLKQSVEQELPAPSLPERPGPGHPLYHYTIDGPHAIATFQYSARQDDELSFKVGDVISLVKYIDSDWLLGQLDGAEGMFPAGFVNVIQAPSPSSSANTTTATVAAPTEQHLPITDTLNAAWQTSNEKTTNLQPTANISDNATITGPRCVARFDFGGENEDDLQFQDGDTIRLLEYVAPDWLRGEFKGKSGMFPLAFVEIVEPLPVDKSTVDQGKEQTTKKSVGASKAEEGSDRISYDHKLESKDDGASSNNEECVALYDYQSDVSTDLSFTKGDVIQIIEHVDDQWIKGKLGDNMGMFPSTFVEVCNKQGKSNTPTTPRDTTDQTNTGFTVEAVYDYTGQTEEDLSFKAGDIITVDEVRGDDWYIGRIGENRGMFPANFVNKL